jgi:hypothetical protein
MYVLNNKQIECFKDLTHLIPNFISDRGDLKLENVEKSKEFRVICDAKDITSYTLKTDTLLEPSPIMEFIKDIEDNYAKKLQTHVPLRYLDILTQTESMYILDSRLGMSIGWRRLFEDFVGENYGVLIYSKPKLRYDSVSTQYGFINRGDLSNWKQHAAKIADALLNRPVLPNNNLRPSIQSILNSNSTLRDSLLDQDEIKKLVNYHSNISKFIHGDIISQPSEKYLKDALEDLLKDCLSYFNNGMRWGVP